MLVQNSEMFFLYTPENMSVSRKSVLFVRENVVG